MPLYEHTVIARPDLSAQQAQALTDTFTEIVTGPGRCGGEGRVLGPAISPTASRRAERAISSPEREAPAAAVAELERTQRIHEDVLRYLTVKVDALEEGPSAVMQAKSSRTSAAADATVTSATEVRATAIEAIAAAIATGASSELR